MIESPLILFSFLIAGLIFRTAFSHRPKKKTHLAEGGPPARDKLKIIPQPDVFHERVAKWIRNDPKGASRVLRKWLREDRKDSD